MNNLTIIGNVTRTPEKSATNSGKLVCNFTVAVNRRISGHNTAEFFRVSAWEQLGENCARYLAKGRKVAVRGPVSARAYITSDGQPRASLEIMAQEVEFLSPASAAADPVEDDNAQQESQATKEAQQGFTYVPDDDIPF